MRLDTSHRSKKARHSHDGTGASALTRLVCLKLQNKGIKSLDTADVVRDVEKLFRPKIAKTKLRQDAL